MVSPQIQARLKWWPIVPFLLLPQSFDLLLVLPVITGDLWKDLLSWQLHCIGQWHQEQQEDSSAVFTVLDC